MKKNFKFLLWLTLATLSQFSMAQKFPDLAKTPPMGWNSWNKFGCNIDEKLVRETADAMVKSGMRDAGYRYVNLDDCWHGERDAAGFIQADAKRFPSGIKALADYIHLKGLKMGIYSDAGKQTCGKRPGSQGFEAQDAKQYARWGIDYLKYDWCNTGEGAAQRNPREAYTTMRDALYAAGRPIVLSICEWGESKPWEWAGEIGHLWRTSGDIANCWECEVGHGSWSSLGVMNTLDKQAGLRKFSHPEKWNDPDMMQVGNLPTLGENRAHFGLWAMLSAPLFVGTDLREMSEEIRTVVTNREVIAVDQDELGIQGFPALKSKNIEFWVKPLAGGEWAVAILNRSDIPQTFQHNWKNHHLEDDLNGRAADFSKAVFTIKDLWAGASAGTTGDVLKVTVPARDLLMYRLKPEK